MARNTDTSFNKWGVLNAFDIPEPWSGGRIAGSLSFIQNDSLLVYHIFDGNEEFRLCWKTSSFESKQHAYAQAHSEVYQYCKQRGILLNEMRRIAPDVMEMKVGSKTTIFDLDVSDAVAGSLWYLFDAKTRKHNFYVKGRHNGQPIFLHQFVKDILQPRLVKHKTGDGLNNLRENITIKQRREKPVPSGKTRHRSEMPGVYREQVGIYSYLTADWQEDKKTVRRRFRITDESDKESKAMALLTKQRAVERMAKKE